MGTLALLKKLKYIDILGKSVQSGLRYSSEWGEILMHSAYAMECKVKQGKEKCQTVDSNEELRRKNHQCCSAETF